MGKGTSALCVGQRGAGTPNHNLQAKTRALRAGEREFGFTKPFLGLQNAFLTLRNAFVRLTNAFVDTKNVLP
jgi:hypothetical protein